MSNVLINMVEWTCCECGVVMQMPEELESSLQESHDNFYCVNGHANYYPEDEEEIELQQKLQNEYVKNAQLEARLRFIEYPTFWETVKRLFKKHKQ